MSSDNPYEPPAAISRNRTHYPTSIAWRIGATLALLFVGMCFLLVMNGQVFTNTLFFLAFCGLSLLIWIALLVSTKMHGQRRLAFYVIMGHLVLTAVVASVLPRQYNSQQQFNDAMKALQRPHRSQADD